LSLILNSEVIILLVKGKMKEYILEQANVDDNLPLHYLLKYRKKNNFFIKKINN
jgi:6-phosphogluconolactonase/glucosamine-6-phosphate isomerase/deaminase